MPRSSTQIVLHFVWATKNRESVLTSQWEPMIYRCIQSECRRSNTAVLALNGMPDHVHLLASLPANVAPAKLMQQIKGVSARFANAELPLTVFLQWQEGYSARSVSRSHVERITQYIVCQKQHHTDNTLQANWEQGADD